jgi:hypothetical protein
VRKLNHVLDGIGWVSLATLSPAGAAAWLYLDNHVDDVKEQVKKLLDIMQKVERQYLPVVSLFLTGISWVDTVFKPTTQLIARTMERPNRNIGQWSGAAKDGWDGQPDRQKAALEAMRDRSLAVQEWLVNLAKENVAYMMKLVEIVGNVIGNLTAVALESPTIVFSIQDLAGTIGQLVADLIRFTTEMVNRVTNMLGEHISMHAKMVDVSSFESNGSWPQSIVG